MDRNCGFDQGRGQFRLIVLSLILICGANTAVSAQQGSGQEERPRISFGYAANIPSQSVGISFFILNISRMGLYLDVKLTYTDPSTSDDFHQNISISQVEGWGDTMRNDRDTWSSLNLGATLPLAAPLYGYIGCGITAFSQYQQYFDPTYRLGPNGLYWIESSRKMHINLLAGVLVIIDRTLTLQLGIESDPKGISAGLAFTIPDLKWNFLDLPTRRE
ncbi:hypothetical protein ACFL6T_05995 [Candidatus Zixiibacteriota bacterium]